MDTQPSSSASPGNLHQLCYPCFFDDSVQEGELISTKGNVKISKTQAARNLARRAKQQLRYSCCFNDFVKDLQEQEKELIKTQKNVDDGVKHSTTQVINVPVVRAWLEREANPLKGNVEELLKKSAARTRKRCCFVLPCPNWVWRYRMAKKLAKKKVEVQKCIKEGDMYIKLEDFVSSPDTQNLISYQKSLEFDSRKVAFEQLMKALKDDKVTMIGLYGMGGCGKTTMAMELKRAAEDENLFKEVPLVIVSNNNKVEVRSIQDKIARALKFPFLGDEESKRAEELRTKLASDHKKTLLILDDVWKGLDFDNIGIPSGKNHKNCKVLITTRSESVCALMKCQTKICLSTLTDEEAWALFQKQAHVSDSLKRLGRLISNECKGLPVAIATLAGTLKDKDEKEWQDALNTLRNSIPMNINEADLQNPYKCLRVSYDNLDSEEAKSLLLLCSMFPEDFEIPIKDLSIFAIGLGLAGEVQLFEGARVKVSAEMNKLISSSLLSLSDVDEGQYVKMHDLVRDVALSIASEENKMVKCVLKKDVTLECNSRRYLWYKEFANESVCSRIEFLRLETNLEVSNEIFKGMGRLRVLFLCWGGEDIGPLSTVSLKPLKNLRCLFLQSWKIDDISFVGDMTKLESLGLQYCSFFELPDVVVTQLRNLRVLHLSHCDMKRNPFEVIGRHRQLEELYFDELVSGWGDINNGDHDEFFKKFSVPLALRRYKIKVGHKFQYSENEILNGHRTLILSCLDTSNAAVMDLARKAEVLLVANIRGGGKNIIPGIFQIGGGGIMNYGWVELWLCDSKEIECLVDTSNHFHKVGDPIPELRKLRIEHMENLGALYHGVPPSGLFEKLEQLYIHRCPVLTCLFTPAVARSLKCLEKLVIWLCRGLKHVLLEEDGTEDEEEIR